MILHTNLLTSKSEIDALAEKLSQKSIIAYDTEFIRESTFFPVLEVIQVATDEESWLIDAQAFRKKHEDLKSLFDVFKNPKILKIVHAASGDQECIYTAYGVMPAPIFDTAIGASLCGFGESVGLANLLRSVLGIEIKKGHARTNWSVRPLSTQLLEYAIGDVKDLVRLAEALLVQLEKKNRKAWALELSSKWENPALFESDPDAIALKYAKSSRMDRETFSVFLEMIRWREKRVRELNVPRRWLADDSVCMDLARVKPKDISHLQSFRGVNGGELKNHPQKILDAIFRGLQNKAECGYERLERRTRDQIPSEAENRAIELTKCFLGMLADREGLTPRHLVNTDQWLGLLRSPKKDVGEWLAQGLITEEGARLIGVELAKFMNGEIGLTVSGGAVKECDLRS